MSQRDHDAVRPGMGGRGVPRGGLVLGVAIVLFGPIVLALLLSALLGAGIGAAELAVLYLVCGVAVCAVWAVKGRDLPRAGAAAPAVTG